MSIIEFAPTERNYAPKDDPKAIGYLLSGRESLIRRDFQSAMRNFKKCYKSRITKALAALLLDQMANCIHVIIPSCP